MLVYNFAKALKIWLFLENKFYQLETNSKNSNALVQAKSNIWYKKSKDAKNVLRWIFYYFTLCVFLPLLTLERNLNEFGTLD